MRPQHCRRHRGSNLDPATLAEVWPHASHQRCIFHLLPDVTDQVLAAVR